jgi:hypothetical protein
MRLSRQDEATILAGAFMITLMVLAVVAFMAWFAR